MNTTSVLREAGALERSAPRVVEAVIDQGVNTEQCCVVFKITQCCVVHIVWYADHNRVTHSRFNVTCLFFFFFCYYYLLSNELQTDGKDGESFYDKKSHMCIMDHGGARLSVYHATEGNRKLSVR